MNRRVFGLTAAASFALPGPGAIALSQMTVSPDVPDMDEAAVETVIRAVGLFADGHRFEPLADLYDARVVLDYASMGAGPPETLSGEEIMDRWAALLPGFDRTRHQVSDIRVEIEGDAASARAHVVADHWLGDGWWRVEGDYLYALARRGAAWRITAHRLTATAQHGDAALAGRAAEVAATRPSPWTRRRAGRDVVMRFLTGLEDKDMERVNAVWAENAVQEMPHRPEGWPLRVEGRDALIRQYAAWPETTGRARFTDGIVFHPTLDPDTVVTEYEGVVDVVATGRTYRQKYVGVFRIEDGRIAFYREYFNPALFSEAFGLTD